MKQQTLKTYPQSAEKCQGLIERQQNAIRQFRQEALNSIAKIYHPKYEFPYDRYDRESTYAEQREYRISSIIERMNKRIDKARAEIRKIKRHIETLR